MVATSQQLLFPCAATALASVAAVYDLRERRIPNLLSGVGLLVGCLLHSALEGWAGLGHSLLAALLAGLVFLVFFIAGGMGAGDVKLMAAVGAMVSLPGLQVTLLATVFLGALGALAVSAYHRKLGETIGNVGALLLHHSRQGLRPHPELNLSNTQTMRLPFAVPIACGCLLAALFAAWSSPR